MHRYYFRMLKRFTESAVSGSVLVGLEANFNSPIEGSHLALQIMSILW